MSDDLAKTFTGLDDRKARRKQRTAALDSSMFESHHVSRHYEKRRQQSQRKGRGRWATAVNRRRSRVVQHLPKFGWDTVVLTAPSFPAATTSR